MYCAVRECVIVGMNQIEYEENDGLLWHPEVKFRINSIFNTRKKNTIFFYECVCVWVCVDNWHVCTFIEIYLNTKLHSVWCKLQTTNRQRRIANHWETKVQHTDYGQALQQHWLSRMWKVEQKKSIGFYSTKCSAAHSAIVTKGKRRRIKLRKYINTECA